MRLIRERARRAPEVESRPADAARDQMLPMPRLRNQRIPAFDPGLSDLVGDDQLRQRKRLGMARCRSVEVVADLAPPQVPVGLHVRPDSFVEIPRQAGRDRSIDLERREATAVGHEIRGPVL